MRLPWAHHALPGDTQIEGDKCKCVDYVRAKRMDIHAQRSPWMHPSQGGRGHIIRTCSTALVSRQRPHTCTQPGSSHMQGAAVYTIALKMVLVADYSWYRLYEARIRT